MCVKNEVRIFLIITKFYIGRKVLYLPNLNMKELKLTVGEDSETIGLQLQVKEVSIHDQEDETGLDRKWIIGVQVGELGYHAMAVHTIDREDATITCVNSWGMEAPVVVLSMKRPDLVMWRLTQRVR